MLAAASWAARLKAGLARTREVLNTPLSEVFTRARVDEALFEELEAALIGADCGVAATRMLIDRLRVRARKERIEDSAQLKSALKAGLLELVAPLERRFEIGPERPYVILLAGVNGTGKTTSIGKLAKWLQAQGHGVMLAAGDTWRAAAREQLATWGERNGVAVISQRSGDPGAVIYDAVAAARARAIDVVIADTAGRLPTQLHLMQEIVKVKRVIGKLDPAAPHEVLLVLDANTGQNALAQVQAFDDALGLTGLILTKLDGSAKGGVVAAIAHARSSSTRARSGPPDAGTSPAHLRSGLTPVRSGSAHVQTGAPGTRSSRDTVVPLLFIGVGEGIDDLRPFVARDFVEALID